MTQAYRATRLQTFEPSSHNNDAHFDERCKAIRSIITTARPALPDDYSRHGKLQTARKIWDRSISVKDTIAEKYLRQCGLVYDAGLMNYIRFNAATLYEPTREFHPSIIAPVHNLDGEFVGIHKTYLASDGMGKANVPGDARRMLGRCHGSHIQLDKADGFRLVLTDSLEMALAIQQACPAFPVWSAMTPGNLRAPVPPNIREIILCADTGGKNSETNNKLVMEAVREHLNRKISVSLATDFPPSLFPQIL